MIRFYFFILLFFLVGCKSPEEKHNTVITEVVATQCFNRGHGITTSYSVYVDQFGSVAYETCANGAVLKYKI